MNLPLLKPKTSQNAILVAIVDDEKASRVNVRQMLEVRTGAFKVNMFESPETFYRSGPANYAMVIIDEFFDKTNKRRAGELVEFILTQYPDVPIIVLSNYPEPASIAKAEQVMCFIDKTIDNIARGVNLRSAVSKALHRAPSISEEAIAFAVKRLQKVDEEESEDTEFISEIQMDRLFYPFKEALPITTRWIEDDQRWIFTLSGKADFLAGFGQDRNASRLSFYAKFHERFQFLQSCREAYRTESQKIEAQVFEAIVDLKKFNALRTVIVPALFGKIVDVDDDGARTVEWWGGLRTMHGLDKVPSFANLQVDEWVRAIVEKRLSSNTIVNVIHASKTPEPSFTEEQRRAFWNQSS